MRPLLVFGCLLIVGASAFAQDPQPSPTPNTAIKKANTRPVDPNRPRPDPFDGASVEKMSAQCVDLDTEAGLISLEMMPDVAPENVRGFLNLVATGSLDTTTFSRTVKDFVIQGGNLTTSDKWGFELAQRASRKLPDEPSIVKHVRGVVSMAQPVERNSATTHFFILVGDAHHLDGKFSAFGRVTKGMEIADAINKAPAEGENPIKPVRIKKAAIVPCTK